MNVLNCRAKSSQPKAEQALHNIWQAETRADAEKAFDLFIVSYDARYPKATLCLQKDREALMGFYNFPAQHWQSIRSSNPIESTFGTIRHRTKRSKGYLSRDGMLHMMFKLGMYAQENWQRLRGFNYLGQVITGVKFRDGIKVKTIDQAAPNSGAETPRLTITLNSARSVCPPFRATAESPTPSSNSLQKHSMTKFGLLQTDGFGTS